MADTKLVLWDWNGTLLDDVALCLECLNRLLRGNGYPQQYDLEHYREIFGFPIEEYYTRAGFDFTRHPYAELAEQFMDYYVPHSEACPLMEDARPALAAVQAMGLPQVMLSASPVDLLTRQVQQRGVQQYFTELLGLGDIYAHSKVELGVRFMQRAGIAPETAVLVGDSVHDFQVAEAMGARCILCSAGHQSGTQLAATGAPVIRRLSQLPALL